MNFSRLIIVFEASQIKEDFLKGISSEFYQKAKQPNTHNVIKFGDQCHNYISAKLNSNFHLGKMQTNVLYSCYVITFDDVYSVTIAIAITIISAVICGQLCVNR